MSKVNIESDATPIGVMMHLYENSNNGTEQVLFGVAEKIAFAEKIDKTINTVDKALTFLKKNGFIVKVEKKPGLFVVGEIFSKVKMNKVGKKLFIEIDEE